MNISFKVNDNIHTLKITAYSTSCSFLLHPVGESKSEMKMTDDVFLPRYFAEKYMVARGNEMIRNGVITESLSEDMASKFKSEIKRLENGKPDNKGSSKSAVGN